jgi:hypothetical protein
VTAPFLLLKFLRHRLRRSAAYLRHGRPLSAAPILFANAFPKSGTHLLIQILKACTRIGPAVDSGLPAVAMYEGESGARRPTKWILEDLHRLRPGDIAYGHLHALPRITAFFEQQDAAVFFLYRDPRDVVVSHVHYVTEIEPGHAHHAHYRSLPDFDARLRTSILGRPELGDLFPNIRARFEPYLGWFDAPGVLSLRFEDLIENRKPVLSGAKDRKPVLSGAKDRKLDLSEAKDRKSAIGAILDHLAIFNFQFSIFNQSEAVDLLRGAVDPIRSPTFRIGTTGGWRNRFTPEHRALFKEVAGELLIELGYESDLSW